MNLDPRPVQVGGHFPRECSQIYPGSVRQGEEVYAPRYETLPTLDQRLSGIGQAAPLQPNDRTETGTSRTPDTGNSQGVYNYWKYWKYWKSTGILNLYWKYWKSTGILFCLLEILESWDFLKKNSRNRICLFDGAIVFSAS